MNICPLRVHYYSAIYYLQFVTELRCLPRCMEGSKSENFIYNWRKYDM